MDIFLNKSFEDMKHCAHIEIDVFILYPIEKNKFNKKLQIILGYIF